MTSELLKAEQAGERVHILSHVPAGYIHSPDIYAIFHAVHGKSPDILYYK